MTIDWFPGHMSTARKEAAATMRTTDVVIEVLDARVPASSLNPVVEQLRKENRRPALKVLNKVDAADPALTPRWLDFYNAQEGVRAIALCARKAGDVARIPAEAQALAPTRNTPAKPLRMMILGVPNVGKSTLMNTLLKRSVAKVGDEPAVTKMQAGFKLGAAMWLVDTPGMMWPGAAQEAAVRLAATHSIGRNAYDETAVAAWLGEELLARYPGALAKRYGASVEGLAPHAVLEWVAARRSLAGKGGGPDVVRAATLLMNDFRAGTLGRITLDVPG